MPSFIQRIARAFVRRAIKSARNNANKELRRQDSTWRGREVLVRNALAAKLPGAQMEVSLPRRIGRIDILTETEVIEVKEVNAWKHAIGQVVVYGGHFPLHERRVHLFGPIQPQRLKTIAKYCAANGVQMTHEK